MDWRPAEELPDASEVVESIYQQVHLRTILSPHSMGHFIRDNLLPLSAVPLRFGLDPTRFTWVRHIALSCCCEPTCRLLSAFHCHTAHLILRLVPSLRVTLATACRALFHTAAFW
jgi:hypothetical protein